MAQPHAKMAMREDAVKSEKPISCSHMVKNTIAFQGVDPLQPTGPLVPRLADSPQ